MVKYRPKYPVKHRARKGSGQNEKGYRSNFENGHRQNINQNQLPVKDSPHAHAVTTGHNTCQTQGSTGRAARFGAIAAAGPGPAGWRAIRQPIGEQFVGAGPGPDQTGPGLPDAWWTGPGRGLKGWRREVPSREIVLGGPAVASTDPIQQQHLRRM